VIDMLPMRSVLRPDGLYGIVGKWLGNLRASPDTAKKLAAASEEVDNDDDPRIRELKESERAPIWKWISGSTELTNNIEMTAKLENLNPQDLVRNNSVSPERKQEMIKMAEEQIEKKLQDLDKERLAIKAKRDETKPEWWKEWEK